MVTIYITVHGARIDMATAYSIETWGYWPGASDMENVMATTFHTLHIYSTCIASQYVFPPLTHESLGMRLTVCSVMWGGCSVGVW